MKQPTSKAGESLPMYEKIALLLKHDSSCAVEKTGVCSCSFYDVANQLTELGQQAIAQERERNKVTGETSDGYHTFNELYEFRKVFNAALFNEWYAQGKYSVHKSERHVDGKLCFGGGWFIVMATLPTGQISNHYETKDWDLFKCEERERADTWDGHEAKDVIDRLLHIITNNHE